MENVLIDSENNVKIIDFGFSTCIPNERKVKIFCGTPSYMAPEIVQKKEYRGPPADVWALGVLLFTILCGTFPYKGSTDSELYGKISNADYKVPSDLQETLSEESLQLIDMLFQIDAEDRPTAKDILTHAWLEGVALPKDKKRAQSNQRQSHVERRESKPQLAPSASVPRIPPTFNIVNNINITTTTQDPLLNIQKQIDPDVVQAIVHKLGYTAEEVKRWV